MQERIYTGGCKTIELEEVDIIKGSTWIFRSSGPKYILVKKETESQTHLLCKPSYHSNLHLAC